MPKPDIDIEVDGDRRTVRFLVALANDTVDRKFLNRIGNFVMTQIKKRTLEGEDVDGVAFEPYTPAYALFRAKKKRPINKVDLFFTGSMMDAITYEIDEVETEVRIFVAPGTDSEDVSNAAKAFYIHEEQDRRFFAVSLSDEVKIREEYEENIRKVIRRGRR